MNYRLRSIAFRFSTIQIIILVAAMTPAAGCRERMPAAVVAKATIPGPPTDLGPADDIVDLEVVTTTDDVRHAAWISARHQEGGVPDFQLWSCASTPGSGRWEEPQLLGRSITKILSMHAGASGVHLLVAPRQRQFEHTHDGTAWREAGSLPDPEGTRIAAAVVTVSPCGDQGLLLTVAADTFRVRRGHNTTWSPPEVVGILPPSPAGHADLSAVWIDERVLIVPIANVTQEGDLEVTPFRYDAVADQWQAMQVLSATDHRADTSGQVALAAVRWRDRCAVLLRSRTTATLQLLRPDGTSEKPWIVSRADPGYAISRLDPTIAIAGAGDGLVAAWIDARAARSDRRWWNPLGGFPWSDSPEWPNNDLMVVHLRNIDLASGAPAGSAVSRLSDAGGFVRAVACTDDSLPIAWLWAGRASVGRTLSATGSPPRITTDILTEDFVPEAARQPDSRGE